MYVVFLEQRKRTEMWRVSWVGGCGGRELPWQMKRCHHWKCAGAWSFFSWVRMSMDAGGALPSHTPFDPDWRKGFVGRYIFLRWGRILIFETDDLSTRPWPTWPYHQPTTASPCEAIEEIEKVPWSGSSPKARNPQGWWRWKTELAISAYLKWFEDAACCLGCR